MNALRSVNGLNLAHQLNAAALQAPQFIFRAQNGALLTSNQAQTQNASLLSQAQALSQAQVAALTAQGNLRYIRQPTQHLAHLNQPAQQQQQQQLNQLNQLNLQNQLATLVALQNAQQNAYINAAAANSTSTGTTPTASGGSNTPSTTNSPTPSSANAGSANTGSSLLATVRPSPNLGLPAGYTLYQDGLVQNTTQTDPRLAAAAQYQAIASRYASSSAAGLSLAHQIGVQQNQAQTYQANSQYAASLAGLIAAQTGGSSGQAQSSNTNAPSNASVQAQVQQQQQQQQVASAGSSAAGAQATNAASSQLQGLQAQAFYLAAAGGNPNAQNNVQTLQ